MLKGMSDNPPFDYADENMYNAVRSPSTIHVKNTILRRYFFKYLFQKAISVFKWNGIPEEWDMAYFLYTLYLRGFIAILNTAKFGTICQEAELGGYNLYRRPAWCIITNPLLNTITANIAGSTGSVELMKGDTKCAIIKLQPDYSPIRDLVGYYADQLALSAEAIGINMLNVKTATVFGAENTQQAQAYKKMFDKISSGEPAVVIGKELLDEEGKPTWFPFTQHLKESYLVSDILSDMRKIEAMYDTEIGIPNANTDKRERLVTEEVNANNVETATRAELWLEEIRKGLNIANSMFDLSISVDWRVKPDTGTVKESGENVEK